MKKTPLLIVALAASIVTNVQAGLAAEGKPGPGRDVAITVYGNGLALVAEKRDMELSPGFNELVLTDVSPSVDADSFRVSAGNGFRVTETTFLPANLTQRDLLEAHIGKTIEISRRGPKADIISVVPAVVLAVEPELILPIGGRIEANPRGRISFPSIPGHIRSDPVMRVRSEIEQGGPVTAHVQYLTGGMSWRAEHVAELNEAMTALDLETRAGISNAAGIDFSNVRLALVAGDVNRTHVPGPLERKAARGLQMTMAADAAPEAAPTREAVAGYHLYRLPGPVTLEDREMTRFSLLSRPAVPVMRELVSTGHPNAFGPPRQARPDHPSIRLKMTNANPSGEPVPGGRIRLYGKDKNGDALFLGEDRLPDLPSGGEATVTAGRAFDVTVKRQRTDVVRQGLGRNTAEMAYRIEVKNGSEKKETVRVIEALAGDWKILTESEPHQRKDGQAHWVVSVDPGQMATITYRTRVRR